MTEMIGVRICGIIILGMSIGEMTFVHKYENSCRALSGGYKGVENLSHLVLGIEMGIVIDDILNKTR